MRDYLGMRSKYPKWAHRRDEHKKRKRKSKRKRRRSRRRRRRAAGGGTSTEGMLVSLLHQLMLRPQTLAKKHGENVWTQYGGAVTPDRLANVRSRDEAARMRQARQGPGGHGAGAGAGAVAAIGPVGPPAVRQPPRARSPSPRRGGYPAEFFRA